MTCKCSWLSLTTCDPNNIYGMLPISKKDQQTTHLQLKISENTNSNKHDNDNIIFKTDNTYKDELSPDIIYLVFRRIITCFDQNWFSVQLLSIRPWRHADKGKICSQILVKTKKEETVRIRVPLFCMDSWKDLENILQLLLHRSILWDISGMFKQ